MLAPTTRSGDIFDGLGGKAGPLFTNDEVQQIVGNVHVPAGKTLTVLEGTVIKFNGKTSEDVVTGFVSSDEYYKKHS